MPYFPALDGIRALAVAAVLAFHGGFSWAVGGYLGVSTFFTLSGFLITSLLLTEHRATHTIDRRAFWSRRFRRLMPTALAGLVLTTLYGTTVATPDQKASLAGDTVAALTYTTNWRFILEGRSYADLFAAPSPVQHFWSLAIEEQFYLLFPIICLAALSVRRQSRTSLRRGRNTLTAVIVGLIALGIAVPLLAGWDHDRIYYGTDSRSPELLLLGALLAALHHRRFTARLATRGPVQTTAAALGAAAIAVMAVAWATVGQQSSWLYDGGFAAYAVVSVALITAAIVPIGPVRRVLAVRPLVYVGTISYGIYVYHWPIFLFVDRLWPSLADAPAFAVKLAVTVPLAVASHRFLEHPIRHGSRIAGRRPWTVAPVPMVAVAAGALAVTLTAPPPIIDFDKAQQELAAATDDLRATPPPSVDPAAQTPPRPRVALFGDSTAMLTAYGLNSSLTASGEADFVGGWTQLGCGISRYGERRDGKFQGPVSEECNAWDQSWQHELDEGQPNVAVVQVGPWEVVDRKLPGDAMWRAIGDPVYDDYLRGEMLNAVDLLSADGAVVVWLSMPNMGAPPGEDPYEFRGNGADPQRRERFNELLAEVEELRPDTMRVVDLGAWLDASGEDQRLRPDGVHFGPDEAREVSDRWLVDEILAAYTDVWTSRRSDGSTDSTDGTDATAVPTAAGPHRVLVVGDSSALGFALALHDLGERDGTWSVGNISRLGCGIGRGGRRLHGDTEQDIPPDCEPFDTEVPRVLDEVRPDVVLVSTGFWDVTDRKLPGDDTWRAPGDQAYDDYLRREFGAAADALHATGVPVVWMTYPAIDLGRDQDPNPDWPVDDPGRMERQNELIREVAADRPWMTVAALEAYADDLPDGAFDPDARPDGIHFTAAAAEVAIDEWLGAILVDAMRHEGR
ncbi:MAG: acyltransferase family protein [Acidimicrobiales bacterium]